MWMDVGDTRWIPRVFHPFFQNERFYRVQKNKQATKTPPVVTIQKPRHNRRCTRRMAGDGSEFSGCSVANGFTHEN